MTHRKYSTWLFRTSRPHLTLGGWYCSENGGVCGHLWNYFVGACFSTLFLSKAMFYSSASFLFMLFMSVMIMLISIKCSQDLHDGIQWKSVVKHHAALKFIMLSIMIILDCVYPYWRHNLNPWFSSLFGSCRFLSQSNFHPPGVLIIREVQIIKQLNAVSLSNRFWYPNEVLLLCKPWADKLLT